MERHAMTVSSLNEDQSTCPTPQDVEPLGVRWLQVWDLDLLDECCCQLGTRRWQGMAGQSVGKTGPCNRPGKHPWWIKRGDSEIGFRHGALSAVDLAAAQQMSTAGNRLAAVPGGRVLVLDLDSDRAFRTFLRIAHLIRPEDLIGAARSVRGYHVWLKMTTDGWSQISALTWLKEWLGPDMKGLDVRCGDRSYVLWPSRTRDGRRWMDVREFKQVVERAYVPGLDIGVKGIVGPVWRAGDPSLLGSAGGEDADIEQMNYIARVQAAASSAGGKPETWGDPGQSPERAAERLELACSRLGEMGSKSGRNNALNRIAYFEGAVCVWAGMDYQVVMDKLIHAGRSVGTHGIAATVRSGMHSGMDALGMQK